MDATGLADAIWLARALPKFESRVIEELGSLLIFDDRDLPDFPLFHRAPDVKTARTDAARTQWNETRPEEQTQIFARAQRDGEGRQAASRIAVPAGDSLPNRAGIERALKPFMRRRPSKRNVELDAAATAETSADSRRIVPVFRPTPERWFEVSLLVEQSEGMRLWSETIRSLARLMGRHGAFRSVRVLQYGPDGVDGLRLETCAGVVASPLVAADPEGRRLCLLFTNGTSALWRSARLQAFIDTLGVSCPVAVVQMLPQALWGHTLLGDVDTHVYSVAPGTAGARLRVRDPLADTIEPNDRTRHVPIFTLEPARVDAWAHFVMSARRSMHIAVDVKQSSGRPVQSASAGTDPIPPERRVKAFRAIASPGAFRLLRLFALAPLTLPIMRMIQRATGTAEQVHLAEVMLSGLIERTTPPNRETDPNEILYDFAPQVREHLIDTTSSTEAGLVDDVLAPERERIRRYVEAGYGRAVDDFQALILDAQGTEQLPELARAFITVSRKIFERRSVTSSAIWGESQRRALPREPAVYSDGLDDLLARIGFSLPAIGRLIAQLSPNFARRIVKTRSLNASSRGGILVKFLDQLTGSGYVQLFAVDELKLLRFAESIDRGKLRVDMASAHGMVAKTVLTGRSLWAGDVRREPSYVEGETSTKSEMTLALKMQQRIAGIVNLEFDRIDALDGVERFWLRQFAELLDFVETAEQPREWLDQRRKVDAVSEHLSTEPSAELYRQRGSAYWYLHEYDLAIADFNIALQLAPDSVEVLFSRGQTFSEMGKPTEALHDLNAVLTIGKAPHAGYLLRARAFAFASLGDWKSAERDIAAALDDEPNNAWAYYTRARMRQMSKQEGALEDFRNALIENGPPLNTMKTREAIAEVLKALK